MTLDQIGGGVGMLGDQANTWQDDGRNLRMCDVESITDSLSSAGSSLLLSDGVSALSRSGSSMSIDTDLDQFERELDQCGSVAETPVVATMDEKRVETSPPQVALADFAKKDAQRRLDATPLKTSIGHYSRACTKYAKAKPTAKAAAKAAVVAKKPKETSKTGKETKVVAKKPLDKSWHLFVAPDGDTLKKYQSRWYKRDMKEARDNGLRGEKLVEVGHEAFSKATAEFVSKHGL